LTSAAFFTVLELGRPGSTTSPEVVLPEGHTIHRLARDLDQLFTGSVVRASALQDRFAAGVTTLDGGTVVGTDAWGKHLFLAVEPAEPCAAPVGAPLTGTPPVDAPLTGTPPVGAPLTGTPPVGTPLVGAPPAGASLTAAPPAGSKPSVWLHVHLGLYGRFTIGHGEAPPPRGALRLRLESAQGWADLRGAIASEILDDDQRDALVARLGEDPLQKKSDPGRPWARISRSRVGIGALLMQQDVLAGVGNVYRAEILFRQGIGPHRPGRSLTEEQWLALWDDLGVLMRAGVRAGRIVTTRPADRRRSGGRVRREDSFYVYRRAGLPCRLCDQPVHAELLAGRTLYWCPTEQPDFGV